MKKITCLFLLFAVTLVVGCKKDNSDPESIPVPQVESISPAKPAPGDEVIVTGKNFGTDISELYGSFGPKKIIITKLTNTELRFNVPDDILINSVGEREYTQTLLLHIYYNKKSNSPVLCSQDITIQFKEPKGWFQQSIITSNYLSCLTATSDTVVWMLTNHSGGRHILKSSNGGNTMETIHSPSGYSFEHGGVYFPSSYFVDDKTAWAEYSRYPEGQGAYYSIAYTTDGKKFTEADTPNDPSLQIVTLGKNWITGLWAKTHNTGLMAQYNGLLSGFFNGFSEGHWATIYQNNDFYFERLTAIDQSEFSIIARSKTSNNTIFLAHKKSSEMVNEYNISTYIGSGVGEIQHLSNGTVYMNNKATKDFYRITWPFTVTTLSQKADAFHFVNANTAYAALGPDIFKTTNGGQTWSKEFTVNAPYTTPTNITEYNGRVWVLMEDGVTSGKKYLLVKYNP